MYVGKSNDNPKKKNKLVVALIIVLLLWIFLASLFQHSPIGLFTNAWKYMLGAEDTSPSYVTLKKQNLKKDSIIADLKESLDMLKKSTNYQQAMVNVESESLNMRQKPLLGAEVVMKIPVGGIVDILYYDNETYRIGGQYGKWVKIRYTGREGWVWGNYVELID